MSEYCSAHLEHHRVVREDVVYEGHLGPVGGQHEVQNGLEVDNPIVLCNCSIVYRDIHNYTTTVYLLHAAAGGFIKGSI